MDYGNYETLIGLVEHYSPSGQESGAVGWLLERMQALGFTHTREDEAGNAVGTLGTDGNQIVLLGHIDTVPGEIPTRLQTTEGGDTSFYGRGTVDAKGPLAAFVEAAAQLGSIPGVQLVVIGAVDEERQSLGARYLLDKYRPAYAIIGEPSQWDRVTLGYKGSAWVEVRVHRELAHTAGGSASAPEIAVGIWQQIQDWARTMNTGRGRIFEQVTPTLRGFSSHQGSFEETATLQIGARLPQGLDPAEWVHQIQELASAGGAVATPTGFPIPAYRAERRSPLVRAFLGSIRDAGGKPGFVVKTGTADLNIVAPAWGCPAVAYGPGDSSLDHTPDEHILLEDYRQAVLVLKGVLQRLADRLTS
ncbi:MAG: [LysW]-lysine hydrolase [Anaerolineales bacterium]|nr:[LysW]-lysine hydrolase [Anaerolineales bacterium]